MVLPFPILFQNNYYIIINKPAGMPVYNNKHTTQQSVEDFFPMMSKRKDGPWLVHRLDQDTAGCLVIALRKQALIDAQHCFDTKQVTKIYWAIVQGKPQENYGKIDTPLLKITKNKQWSMQANPKGQSTSTQWKLLGSNGHISCLELKLLTGRTHQARAHCAILGHPIIGDTIYNSKGDQERYLHLFSREISLPLSPPLSAIAEPPKHMISELQQLDIL
ncbi:23S rRNA- or tRNA-specific (RluA) (PDB:2I82) [Commensalibacter communis]|uniref:23S rRNA- or tRNA-specific (RluA) n=1 Tax=Commensalibacter communis TaxID=2972786 RepID=A0A9W4TNX6_9PROT|nr:RNA pseudouridine synthase [Commensalibacter communis]CAI3939918.1 23S rRNA- or tRNA-specific (RluA) (PDB:2I82) [Commensalibacter communis]CAI3940439.1 23S rRNA- or tRNA-specific (RluA) (PDB:2I82) [Commensalibacter communis]CAI3943048.1 23S rRNA- or tRNA-specific (RluA) (PDB:2I82) [Commensalibacter communis]CAI3946728.1 23S rRNA- or tRNA-specific (RluA) (PDB:2I82) [Commensalibacter communis]